MADADALYRTPASRDLVRGYGPSRHDLSALRLGLSFTISHWQASGGAYHTEVVLSSMATFPEQKPENCTHISFGEMESLSRPLELSFPQQIDLR